MYLTYLGIEDGNAKIDLDNCSNDERRKFLALAVV